MPNKKKKTKKPAEVAAAGSASPVTVHAPSSPSLSSLAAALPPIASTSTSTTSSTSAPSPSTTAPSTAVAAALAERTAMLNKLLDGTIPDNEIVHLLALRGFWPGYLGQVNVGKSKQAQCPSSVCTVSQGLTAAVLPNKRTIIKETINPKGQRELLVQDKPSAQVIVPPTGSAGYGFEFCMWTKSREHEVFEVFNHVVTELLLHDVDYLSLLAAHPCVVIDRVSFGKYGGWPAMLSFPQPPCPLAGTHSLHNGTFRFIQITMLTPEEHLSMYFSDVKALMSGLKGLSDMGRASLVSFDPSTHPTSLDHLRQAVFENDLAGVERWVSGAKALRPSDSLPRPFMIEGVCYRDHPLVLACKKGRNPDIFKALLRALPELPMLNSQFRSSRAPSRNAHVLFEAVTQDQPVIVQALLEAEQKTVDVDVRCLLQQETSLHLACIGGSSATTVRVLLEHKADVLSKMDGDVTCVMVAAQSGNKDALEAILDHTKRTVPRHFAELINAREVKQATALMLGALSDQPACVELLLSHGADKSLSLQGPASMMTAQDFAKLGKSKACLALLGGTEEPEDEMPGLV